MTSADVRERREALRMTQRQFAGLIGVTMNTVWRWENGYPIDPAWAELIQFKAAAPATVAQPA